MSRYFSLIITALVVANLAVWHSPFWGLIFGISYLLWHGYLTGKFFLPGEKRGEQTWFGLFFLLIFFSASGAIIYYLYKLTLAIIIGLIAVAPIVLYYLNRLNKKNNSQPAYLKFINQLGNWLNAYQWLQNKIWQLKYGKKLFLANLFKTSGLTAAFLLLTIINWFLVLQSATTESINSIWQVLTPNFLLTYFLATLVLLLLVTGREQKKFYLYLVIGQIFLTLSVATVVYQVGYGFDPFIHRAAERLIAAVGVVTPKTPYYIGQYSLVAILTSLLQLPLVLIDKWLLPILFSVFIPAGLYFIYRRLRPSSLIILNSRSDATEHFYYLWPLIILILPFNDFIATTPQGLANFLALIVVFGSLLLSGKKIKFGGGLLIFLGAATILVHPLTGIPVFLFSLAAWLLHQPTEKPRRQKIILTGLIILTLISLPLVFWGQGKLGNAGNQVTLANFNWDNLTATLLPVLPAAGSQFTLLTDYWHLLGDNSRWLILLLAAVGLYLTVRRQDKKYWLYPIFFLILLGNYFFLKIFIAWTTLINYEQGDYPARILNLSFYFLLPLVIVALAEFGSWLKNQPTTVKSFWLILLSLILTASLYISYPYSDSYYLSHYYSVSAADLATVNYIDRETTGDYAVLANQSVSAAAIDRLGFKKYFTTATGNLFYYPLPTASPLYQSYLQMVYTGPTKAAAATTMKLMSVNQIYLVINDYWTDADKIISAAKTEATSWTSVDGGKNYVFYFKK
ncbi:MAG: hypothetical protein WCT37_01200 [Patescibacteria group bacterium]|jgi:hypothetical protein